MGFFNKNIRWVLPSLFLLAGALTVWPLHQYCNLTLATAWKDGLTTGVVTGLAVSMVIWAVKAYPVKVGVIIYAFLIGVIAGFLVWIADYSLLRWWIGKGDMNYMAWLNYTRPDRFIIALFTITSVSVIIAMDQTREALEERFRRQTSAEGLLREAELFRLRQQFQPHFLYNSLNAINSLVLIAPDKAQEMIGRLSDFLRASVKKDNNEFQPVAEEMAYLETYLAIESVRFGDRLQVIIEKGDTDDAQMPAFLLQPLIENAIKFGLYGRTGEVVITISIVLESQMLQVTITNPFDPLVKPPSGTGFGLEGVRRRLYLLFGRSDLLETSTADEQFITVLKIPQSHV